MSESLVSVIVPIYNAGPYLEQCLDSIVGQTHKDLEIILLNDGSTDDSLAEATGTWISIVEPDDWIEPGMYADMLAFAT